MELRLAVSNGLHTALPNVVYMIVVWYTTTITIVCIYTYIHVCMIVESTEGKIVNSFPCHILVYRVSY